MPARKHVDGSGTSFGLPRNLLVPYVLLFLKNWSAHGYQILQTLTLLGFAAVDPATVYRTLRQMEREGLVVSGWETGIAGPARRTYRITDAGEQFLNQWAEALGVYQRFLDRFFDLYAGGGRPSAEDALVETSTPTDSIEPISATESPKDSRRNGSRRPQRSKSGGE